VYKQVETDKKATTGGRLHDGTEFTPVATLVDEYGGRCQIAVDDHCYVLRLRQDDGTYKTTTHIFREAFKVLVTLPEPK